MSSSAKLSTAQLLKPPATLTSSANSTATLDTARTSAKTSQVRPPVRRPYYASGAPPESASRLARQSTSQLVHVEVTRLANGSRRLRPATPSALTRTRPRLRGAPTIPTACTTRPPPPALARPSVATVQHAKRLVSAIPMVTANTTARSTLLPPRAAQTPPAAGTATPAAQAVKRATAHIASTAPSILSACGIR